ncbi:hypothetical protein CC85DRAFT_292457 [Cutaneotrichosporon oleaginosum]|uniref:Uncharacterized protein n=1 Tax=Cutaneotrichosporon oleaginosum TaxID=879819 RepID=A0A0J0XL95_9TREE|nr:uncharacterized protein CC85DRAFT_292457 [Cutaneotrichosporon oleaginosum]KLT41870.1 hypothetical protein CC85DRAFT_292457 [Cutaneotrichosporon oleaginosum]TXT14788.1 hypothetical protein COLE_00981 [Cutaneotrichosporon oleaginosum]
MKFTALLLPLVAVAMAAPAPNSQEARAPDVADQFDIINGVIVGPGGYYDENGFHEGEYPGNKRDLAERDADVYERTLGLEERTFFLKGKLLGFLGKGWKWGKGGLHGPGDPVALPRCILLLVRLGLNGCELLQFRRMCLRSMRRISSPQNKAPAAVSPNFCRVRLAQHARCSPYNQACGRMPTALAYVKAAVDGVVVNGIHTGSSRGTRPPLFRSATLRSSGSVDHRVWTPPVLSAAQRRVCLDTSTDMLG